MTFRFVPAASVRDRHGVFVALVGGTNSGKTYSAMRLARGIAGPDGKIAVLDAEGGRTLHLKSVFDFDVMTMDPPFRPQRFAEAAQAAEEAGYACLVIDSFSMEWVGLGGVLDWQAKELDRMAGDDFGKRERMKMAAWIAPKTAHKAMVYALLQRRIPIIFSIRGEETVKPGDRGEKPQKIFKSITNKDFPFEVTVSFRLAADRKGVIDLSDPTGWKMEGAHREIFRDGETLSEAHGAALARWSIGAPSSKGPTPPEVDTSFDDEDMSERLQAAEEALSEAAKIGMEALKATWSGLAVEIKTTLKGALDTRFKPAAIEADRAGAASAGTETTFSNL